MKRSLSTTVLFVLLILTVVALTKIGVPKSASAFPLKAAAVAKDGNK
ncbi:MAG TPA: hypothetical protein VLF71_04955 [Candidatus Saccharimonadales bacterium]|nr:hypothetical protein [Candidatus Saccharimonadales bacterium]